MSKARTEKARQTIEFVQAYAEEHPGLGELIQCFIRTRNHPKVMMKIRIGKYNPKDETFVSNLTSNVRFANVLIDVVTGEPKVYLRNSSSENLVMFNLTAIEKVYYHKSNNVPKPLDYSREEFALRYLENDYYLAITFEN